jgi:AcrR family transcriptional regulator
MTDTEPGLPAAVELLWGLRERSRRGGPRPALSLERIVAAGIDLADAGGLTAVSMSRLAEALGFTTMSLYRYVPSKDDLLVLMLDAAIGTPPDSAPDAAWRTRCEDWAVALQQVYRRHPWALDLPISGMPAGPSQLTWLDRLLAALAGTRLASWEKMSFALSLSAYARAQATLTRDLVAADRRAAETGTEAPDWGRMITRLADRERFPAVFALAEQGEFADDGAGDDFGEQEFGFGLARLLDGLEALDRSRQE